jgi:metal-responsive CopG/Arc/MetJ family transcriptional regulator
MKTAISVPDETFHRVERRAAELGVSRSEFYATAAARYLDELDSETLTSQIDEALERGGQAVIDEAREFAEFSSARLAKLSEDEDW